MSIDILERAVARLEELKEFQGAPWETVDYNEGMSPPRPLWGVANDEYFNPPADEEETWVGVEVHTGSKDTADLIAALSRTVDPLLDILRFARALFGAQVHGKQAAATVDLALALARAVLGERDGE